MVTPAGKFFILVLCSGRGYSSRLGEAYHQLVNKFVGQQVFVEFAALILSTSTATSQQPCFIWIIPTRANFLMLAQAPTNSTVKNCMHWHSHKVSNFVAIYNEDLLVINLLYIVQHIFVLCMPKKAFQDEKS